MPHMPYMPFTLYTPYTSYAPDKYKFTFSPLKEFNTTSPPVSVGSSKSNNHGG